VIELAAYALAAREWYRPAAHVPTPYTYEELDAFKALEPEFAAGDRIVDKHGGAWTIVSLDMSSNRWRVRPNHVVNGICPVSGYSPFAFAPRAMWAGEPTWLADEAELRTMAWSRCG
jgi:hypothetical protein